MQHLSILSILLIAVLTVSAMALPLTSDEKSSQTEGQGGNQIQKSNERQGRVWSPFGDASASRRGRFNRDIDSSEKLTTKTESEKGAEAPKSNERQGRAWSPFGEASSSRRGRFNRDLSEKTPSTSTTTEEKQEQKLAKVESKVPKKSVSSSKTQLKTDQKEREGRVWSFGEATKARPGRVSRDVESSEKLTTKTETEKVAEKLKSNRRQGRAWSPFGKASPSGRGLFNVAT